MVQVFTGIVGNVWRIVSIVAAYLHVSLRIAIEAVCPGGYRMTDR